MRLLVLNWRDWEHPWAGGAETLLREIATRLVKQGHDVTLLCQRGEGQSEHDTLEGVTIIRRGGGLSHSLITPFWLLHHQNQFDLVWEFTNKIPYGGPLFINRPLVAAAMHVNGSTAPLELGPLGWVFMGVERVMYRFYRSTPFVAISESTRSEVVGLGVGSDNVAVMHCGISEEYARQPSGPRADKPTIICISRLKRYKRIDLLLRAMPRVIAEVPEARLIVVGTGDQADDLKSLTRALGLTDHITFTGHVDELRKIRLLDRAWIQIQPSMKEGWGLTVVEAAARGVPTIAFDVPGLRDSIVDGMTGVILPACSPEALSLEMVSLLRDDRRREALSRAALERSALYSWDAASRLVERVFMDATEVVVGGLVLREGT